MKETTRRRILGERLYKTYRRIRYLSYRSRVLKLQKREQFSGEKQHKIKPVAAKDKRGSGLGYRVKRIIRIIRFLSRKQKIRRREKNLLRKEIRQKLLKERAEVRQRMRDKTLQEKILVREQQLKDRREKRLKRYRRRRIIRFLMKRQFRRFGYAIRHPWRMILLPWSMKIKKFAQNTEQRNDLFMITANSTVWFLLAYMFIYIIGQIITIWASRQFEYQIILFYNKIYFDIDATEWFADSVKLLYSTMPMTGLFLGLICLIIYSNIRRENIGFKLFFLWGFIHGINMFFGALLMGTLFNKGFGYVVTYMYYRDTGKMIFAIISIFALLITGAGSTKSFLISANTYFNYLDQSNRKFFINSQVLLPAVIGTFLIILIKLPNNLYFSSLDLFYFDLLLLGAIALIIIPIMLSHSSYLDLFFDDEPKKKQLDWKPALVVLIVLVLWRLGLSGGISI
ncbi:MAG: hypothetical protein JW861_01135 [Bacteroidales bacterium]|nr:hypothetical protein [Bacteroidales bacterium]